MASTVKVEVAYGQDSLAATPSYTNVADDFAQTVTVRRGRQYLTDRTEAGTADIGFVDTTGDLDPTNTAGAFYPMNPNAPARVQLLNQFTSTYVPIFTGLIQGCPQTIRSEGAPANKGTLPLVDVFSLLAIRELPPGVDFSVLAVPGTYPAGAPPQTTNISGDITYAEQTVQDRMYAIFADIGFPSALLNISSGNVRVQQTVYSPGYTALSALQDAADAEASGPANIFVLKTGKVAFRGRLSRGGGSIPLIDYGVNTWKCGDVAAVAGDSTKAQVALHDLVIDRDIAKIVNNALFTPQGIDDADVAGQLVKDMTSITTYGPRSITGQNLINAGATAGAYAGLPLSEMLMVGQFWVGNFKDPATRIEQATFRWISPTAANAEDHWNLLCNAEIGDILSVTVTFPSGAGLAADQYFIEGISYQIGLGNEIAMTLDLSPVYTFFPTGWDPNA